jgi:DNA-binding response OmpR family regulator
LEASGEAAIAKLESKIDIRALITDIDLLKEASDWEVARRARELFANLPVVYVTSVAAEEWTSQGVPKSILIPKPFTPTQITTAISQLLNEASPAQSRRV